MVNFRCQLTGFLKGYLDCITFGWVYEDVSGEDWHGNHPMSWGSKEQNENPCFPGTGYSSFCHWTSEPQLLPELISTSI
jgi:hypothetical protein